RDLVLPRLGGDCRPLFLARAAGGTGVGRKPALETTPGGAVRRRSHDARDRALRRERRRRFAVGASAVRPDRDHRGGGLAPVLVWTGAPAALRAVRRGAARAVHGRAGRRRAGVEA